MSHSMLMRGEDRRKLELAELCCIRLLEEGPTSCWPMLIDLDNGK